MDWTKISLTSVVAFLGGWLFFGLFGAVVLAIIVLALMGTIKVTQKRTRYSKKRR